MISQSIIFQTYGVHLSKNFYLVNARRELRSLTASKSKHLCYTPYTANNLRALRQSAVSFKLRTVPARRGAVLAELELTEENVEAVLVDARQHFDHLFDESVGMTGKVTLAELDGPVVLLRLEGRFWHERSMILARMGTYLMEKIPEILDVDIEDESQLSDSPENF
mmetsp:Transcript_5491/g.7424  ORF Transcript_5491/g.7424 Transcript_5491/m.7424 type:complete len:166 (+) Transcript_5491:209-706(+)|eukprot:CAMPEP_0196590984 /NCGR_PEP_ID=MMETSP1081-20130531/68147_1 /TAXON_ID=36882 /ORGANISM="Pyramimonas amylifera, Strain CCMP720" /LENGTH=165 /DNA_ID=CAMNT_0041914225 /DNA_START=187 /DNA_END=684 /DNA_ORIENTATION=+